jgi:porphobilinogen synthase
MSHDPSFPGQFPSTRLRRLRYHPQVRRLIRQVSIEPRQLVLPLFVRSGSGIKQPISSMPGQYQMSLDVFAEELPGIAKLGLGGILLFGIPSSKDALGSDAFCDTGMIQQALQVAASKAPNLLRITDLCCCEYTSHGHCGALTDRTGRHDVDNDETLELLGKQAVSHAKAGADIVAPSGMMDGMVGAIRSALDSASYEHVPILSYAAKYASAAYGPFREAAESTPQWGDRKGYQMDPASDADQALREVALDLAEGADMIMVKPAMAYLDIVRAVSERFPGVPIATYNVSGEYSMVKAAAEKGWIDEKAVAMESLIAMRRAGADILITYWAKDVVEWLKKN